MPQYIYHCDECGSTTSNWYASIPAEVPGKVRCSCGACAGRSWHAEHVGQPDAFRPYWTPNMGHEPVFVRSRAHERRLCKERHLERLS
jgi:hypothetical protein